MDIESPRPDLDGEDLLPRIAARLEEVLGARPEYEELYAEILYATAIGDVDSAPLARRHLESFSSRSIVCACWLSLCTDPLPPIDDAGFSTILRSCRARARNLLVWEWLRLHQESAPIGRLWPRLAPELRPNLRDLGHHDVQRRSPMASWAIRTGVPALAALDGPAPHRPAWADLRAHHDHSSPARGIVELSIALASSDAGLHREVIEIADQWPTGTAELTLALETLALRSLVATGTQEPTEYADTSASYILVRHERQRAAWARIQHAMHELERDPPLAPAARHLPLRELEQWSSLARTLAALAGLTEPLASPGPDVRAVEFDEHDWRSTDGKNAREARALLERYEDLFERELDPPQFLRVRLAWCRLVVDLYGPLTAKERPRFARRHSPEQLEEFQQDSDYLLDRCAEYLERCIADADALGLPILTVQSHDQYAVLLDRRGLLESALSHARQATRLIVELLRSNTDHGAPLVERGLLQRYWAIIDRGLELRVRHALALEDASERDAMGREIHAMVDQAQVLALAEVRRVHRGGGQTAPHRFAWTPDRPDASVLSTVQGALRERQALLQYFQGASFVLVFACTRERFVWRLIDAPGEDGPWWSPRALSTALRQPATVATLELLPDEVELLLQEERVEHVFVVPHGALWDIPFGHLALGAGLLSTRCSLTYAPTARAAIEAAEQSPPRARDRRRGITFVHGIDLDPSHVEAERAALEHNFHRISEARRLPLSESLAGYAVIHVLAHGTRPHHGEDSSQLLLRAPTEQDGSPTPRDVAQLELESCSLAILNTCWSGRQIHHREDPLLGFPQAMTDVGIDSVVAPFQPVLRAFTPHFTRTMYQLARFLPAPEALRRTIAFYERHWDIVLDRDETLRAQVTIERSGDAKHPLDRPARFDYRHFGSADTRTPGSLWASLWARLRWSVTTIVWESRRLLRSRTKRGGR